MIRDFSLTKILKRALQRGGDFAEIYFEQSQPTSILCEDNRIEKVITGIDTGIGIRVIYKNKTSYAYTNLVNERALLELADSVSIACNEGMFEKNINLSVKKSGFNSLIKELPQKVSMQKKIHLVLCANKTARSWDKRIRQVKVVYRDSIQKLIIVNSAGDFIEDERISTLFMVQVIASQDDIIQTGYEPVGGGVGFEFFKDDPPENVAERASSRAILMLEAQKAPGGMMPVVLSSEAGGTMIHEAIGHGLEADLAQEGISVYSDRLGQTVASPLITVIDDATLPTKRGSYCFDDEGTPSQKTILVEKGQLKGYLYDRLTALKDNVNSTGNGRRESYRNRPIPRMSNTLIAPGESNPVDILKSTHKGIFVKKMGGGQVNTVNGDFIFEVSEGYLIESGKIGTPVRGATLTGNGPDILKKIDMIGNDLEFGIGTCGKDGQGVPVADAQPTLRIPEIVVGGEV
jgi:TldD protein